VILGDWSVLRVFKMALFYGVSGRVLVVFAAILVDLRADFAHMYADS
jgi:hypothetical protein